MPLSSSSFNNARAQHGGYHRPMIWNAYYATGPLGGDEGNFFVLAADWSEARELARAYLEEEHKWERCGYHNLDISAVSWIMKAGELLIY